MVSAEDSSDDFSLTSSPDFCAVSGDHLSAAQFHDLIRLRIDVFVVEQACAYPELDGRDLSPSTTHLWYSDAKGPTASLRILMEHDPSIAPAWRIGRVVTRRDVRGSGLSSSLMGVALQQVGSAQTVLEAQSRLQSFYRRFGYEQTGPEYVEDGIPHIPMSRAAGLPVTTCKSSKEANQ